VFVPKQWENTYYEWMRNIQPWCISRQLWWGHQIPAWYGPDGKVFVAYDEAEAQDQAQKEYGKAVALTRDPDVLDTWFSSGLGPFSTLGWPEQTAALKRYYPGDVLVTGFDIIFFWVARMMMLGIHFMGDVPFRTVYIHALVRDEHGQKMSKSKGNVIDPLELIEKYGADALRFTLTALAAQGRDIKMSEQRVEGYRNFATKLWNATRFAQMNQCEPVAGFDPAALKEPVNRWIVGRLVAAKRAVEQAMAQYRYNDAAGALYRFVWDEFCDWYVEFTKPVLQDTGEGGKTETRATTAWVIGQMLHLLHPFMPFITEELWEQMRGDAREHLITARWPDYADRLIDPTIDADLDWVIRLVTAVRAMRAEMNIPPGPPLTLLLRDAGAATLARLDKFGDLVKRLARADKLDTAAAEPPKGAAQIVLDEATIFVPLAGVIDIADERKRLTKELDKAKAEGEKIGKKLGNEQFLAKANPDVVAEQRQKLEEAKLAVTKLTQALDRLTGL
jgi:valyl-tRNA synthetase